ncbi:Protein of unknown function [Thermobacillus xylanilyticus]|uniref:Uncharacterized protein n=1 Tax=Thermobacillus xylanilyticus TaxID=76633 RepID=A0ABN7S612_THEXY|nr:Protein of unknown function [Thermobacillus xylanilyticus]
MMRMPLSGPEAVRGRGIAARLWRASEL